jgi:hypothetical protein
VAAARRRWARRGPPSAARPGHGAPGRGALHRRRNAALRLQLLERSLGTCGSTNAITFTQVIQCTYTQPFTNI